MKKEKEIEFGRLVGNERRIGNTLASVSRHWQGDINFKEIRCIS